MAREFQDVQAQPLFDAPTPYQPKAEALEVADNEFVRSLDDRMQQQYATLTDQYENKKISDGDFADQIEFLVSTVADDRVKQKWEPVVTEARYTVFANAQTIADLQLQAGLTDGSISPADAAAKYEAMAGAAMNQGTQSAIRDAANWDLKAAVIRESAKGSGGPRGPKVDTEGLTRKFELSQFQLDQERQVLDNELNRLNSLVQNGTYTQEQANQLRTLALNDYSASVSLFGYDSEILDYTSKVNPEGGLKYLNDQIDYVRKLGGPAPKYYSGLGPGIQALQDRSSMESQAAAPQEAQSPKRSVDFMGSFKDPNQPVNATNAIINAVNQNRTQNAKVSLVAPETQRQSNPLGLGSGGSFRA